MGLECSGELSDLTFYSMVEAEWLERPEVQREWGVLWYRRFRDDITLFMEDDADAIGFFKELQAGLYCKLG